MARSMLSLGMELLRAFSTARRSLKFESLLPPPSRAAMAISRARRVNNWPRRASATPFWCLIVFHFECPDMGPNSSFAAGPAHPRIRRILRFDERLYHAGKKEIEGNTGK